MVSGQLFGIKSLKKLGETTESPLQKKIPRLCYQSKFKSLCQNSVDEPTLNMPQKIKLEMTMWKMKKQGPLFQINYIMRNSNSRLHQNPSLFKILSPFEWDSSWFTDMWMQPHWHNESVCNSTQSMTATQQQYQSQLWQKPFPADVKQQFSSQQIISWISQEGVTTFCCQWLSVWPLGCNFHQLKKSSLQTQAYFSLCCYERC